MFCPIHTCACKDIMTFTKHIFAIRDQRVWSIFLSAEGIKLADNYRWIVAVYEKNSVQQVIRYMEGLFCEGMESCQKHPETRRDKNCIRWWVHQPDERSADKWSPCHNSLFEYQAKIELVLELFRKFCMTTSVTGRNVVNGFWILKKISKPQMKLHMRVTDPLSWRHYFPGVSHHS